MCGKLSFISSSVTRGNGRVQAPVCSLQQFHLLLLDAGCLRFFMPQAPWGGYHSPLTWLWSKVRSASCCGWGRKDARGWWNLRTLQGVAQGCTRSQTGGKLQPQGLTHSWCILGHTHTHTYTPPPTQKSTLIHPEHHQSFCNPQGQGKLLLCR